MYKPPGAAANVSLRPSLRRSVPLVLAAMLGAAFADDLAPVEAQRIEYLIAAIETLDGAQFIRNGTAHEAGAAADHLRLKLRRAGSRVETAEDFIRYCASRSSVSGKPYQIRFADGRLVTAEEFLRGKLDEFRATGESARKP